METLRTQVKCCSPVVQVLDRAKRCFLAPSPSISMSRRAVRSGDYKVAAHISELLRITAHRSSPAQGWCATSRAQEESVQPIPGAQRRAQPSSGMLQPGTGLERLGWGMSMDRSGSWTQHKSCSSLALISHLMSIHVFGCKVDFQRQKELNLSVL